MPTYEPTERTRVRRRPERGVYDRDLVHRIVDEALVCHVAFVHDGEPRVLPTTLVRLDEDVYIHGSTRNGLLNALADGRAVSISVTLVDGVVAGRSGFGCSVNYRSVVVYGTAEQVSGADKERVMDALVQDIAPGHRVRRLTGAELDATLVLRVPLVEVSAKVRDQGVTDAASDYELDLWAGVIPLALTAGTPVDDAGLAPGVRTPDFAVDYHR